MLDPLPTCFESSFDHKYCNVRREHTLTDAAAGYRETIHPAIRATTSRSIPL